ncbi:DUF3368 domain-containing protein [Thiobaca trueperi]|uniref:Putative nucleic acid-binding protein n=1 Tax=Thiobaca trueperi TaxID=127458 RepID=A0A4R3N5Y0_9GAMM|nr:DUF3368 domain-containing protein [Thiobaca trueperi]TCT22219.1 putative nucleic acid-binding protein [Thiobaca trueperi]
MKLVINASPLIFLAKVDALNLLSDCFDAILTPPAVVAEIGALRLPSFINVTALSEIGSAFVRGAIGSLHAGELEVMILARDSGIGLVGLDDLLARRKAQQMGLQPIGTIGILLLARERGILTNAEAWSRVEALVKTHGLYLSPRILESVRTALQ